MPKKEFAQTSYRWYLVPDIVAQLSDRKAAHQLIVGFAAQTGDIITPAIGKLQRKKLDAIVANPIDKPGSGFGSTHNEAVILLAAKASSVSQTKISHGSKLNLAHQLYDTLLTQ